MRCDEATPNGWSPDRVTISLLSRKVYNYSLFRLVMGLLRRLSPPRKDISQFKKFLFTEYEIYIREKIKYDTDF
ncbi:hypothetical protein KAI52_01645 [Candidatus Parcubacteria bacterium]|nr:hypothetical protein [Candidatus Parcubacteria bacterium]